jgi:uncharacterized protein
VSSVLDAVSVLDGLQVGDADIITSGNLGRVAREAKVPVRIAEALWAIERRRWDTEIDAPVDPEALRDILFELAARLPREDAIAVAARRLGVAREAIVGSLHADRQVRRLLVAPAERTRPADLIARYNLALVQALLARSMEVHATISGDSAPIAAAAKRDGLLAQFDVGRETTSLSLTGPLAIFHDTAKYGRMIARFIPSLVAMPSWSLRARVMLGEASAAFELGHGGAIAFAATVSAAPDGRLARRVARALRSAGIRVDLHPPVVQAGRSFVVPDFSLEWPGGRVLVDVVPFATPEYLASKLETVAALDEPMLVCCDERFASVASPCVVPYRGEIDALALAAAALGALERRVSASYVPSSEPPSRQALSPGASASPWPPASSRASLPPSSRAEPAVPQPPGGTWPRPFRA